MVDVYSDGLPGITGLIPYRNNLIATQDNATHIIYGRVPESSSTITTALGLPKKFKKTLMAMAGSIIFKTADEVVALVPTPEGYDDSKLNTRFISKQIKDQLRKLDADPNVLDIYAVKYLHEY
jgi:hypothetical protein